MPRLWSKNFGKAETEKRLRRDPDEAGCVSC